MDAKRDLVTWPSPNLSFSLHLEKSAQKAFAVLRMIRRTFSRITCNDFQILYGDYVRPLLEYANPVVYSGRTKDVILIERVQRTATKMVANLKCTTAAERQEQNRRLEPMYQSVNRWKYSSNERRLNLKLSSRLPASLPKESQLCTDLANLSARVNKIESELISYRSVQPPVRLLTPDSVCDPSDLAKALVLIDTLASEVSRRMECRKQVLIYNVSDRIPVERTKAVTLTACNMHDTVCTARRLRKFKPSLRCPMLMQFRDENDATRLLTSQALLSSTQTFQTVKVKAVRTRIQRQLTRNSLSELLQATTDEHQTDSHATSLLESCWGRDGSSGYSAN
ncbi:hypothetical protein CLF_101770 [Clonorchis sinensis]|uniref:Uncharacterized protein n=1 Tax=Clonorchis sinensis TaxID=79923 RepID=G7Y6I9_CLOSI|nr:hypothetical protein CLF_101770 [Clonorchis sinensis]